MFCFLEFTPWQAMNDKLQILAKGLTTCIVNDLVFNFILVFFFFLNCLRLRDLSAMNFSAKVVLFIFNFLYEYS